MFHPLSDAVQESSQRSNVQLLHFQLVVLAIRTEGPRTGTGCPSGPSVAPWIMEDTAKVDVSIMSYWRTMTSEVKYICPSIRSTVTSTDTPVAPLPYKAAFVNLKVSHIVSLLPTHKHTCTNPNTAPYHNHHYHINPNPNPATCCSPSPDPRFLVRPSLLMVVVSHSQKYGY